jgi:hypothetical protein
MNATIPITMSAGPIFGAVRGFVLGAMVCALSIGRGYPRPPPRIDADESPRIDGAAECVGRGSSFGETRRRIGCLEVDSR